MIFGTDCHQNAGYKDRALNALINRLFQDNWVIPAIGMVEDTDANIVQMAALIRQSPIPLHLFHYTGGKIFDSTEKVRNFYRATIGDFATYEGYFDAI